jgi:predicted glutamine amidotransferase
MCRMLAKISLQESSIMEEMLQCPYSLQYLSENGRQSSNPEQRGHHRDGCGIAFVDQSGMHIEKRRREEAWDASYIQTVREARSKVFIAHNRRTSQGLETRLEGTHPFSLEKNGIRFAFCHNGTAESYVPEALARGTADTQLFFEELIATTNHFTTEAIAESVQRIARKTQYDSISGMLITDRNELFVWRIHDESPDRIERLSSYYTLYLSFRKGSVVIASEPLDDSPWVLLPNKTFLGIVPNNESTLLLEYKSLTI